MRDSLAHTTPQTGDIVNDPGSFWHGAEIVAAITRAQLIADGVLVDLTNYARSNGIGLPLAMTATAYAAALREPRVDREPSGIDVSRLILWLRAVMTAAASRDAGAHTVNAPFTRIDYVPVRLKITIGPGDEGEPVLTVMLPEED